MSSKSAVIRIPLGRIREESAEKAAEMTINRRKRYNITMSPELYEKVGEIAARHNVSRPDVVRTFIKVGLLAEEVQESEDEQLCIKKGDTLEVLRLVY